MKDKIQKKLFLVYLIKHVTEQKHHLEDDDYYILYKLNKINNNQKYML